jgi:hypothetical protein
MKEKQWVRYVSNVRRRLEGGLSGQDNTLTPHAPPRYNTTRKKVPEEPDRYVNVVTRQLFFPSALSFSRFLSFSLAFISLYFYRFFSMHPECLILISADRLAILRKYWLWNITLDLTALWQE